jgi:hypothetical protein
VHFHLARGRDRRAEKASRGIIIGRKELESERTA